MKTKACRVLPIQGLHVLPGIIDTQVHFREPGLEHKETIQTGTMGAVLGGVTTIFDMPNTNPPTETKEELACKIQIAQKDAYCHFAFFIGASGSNVNKLGELELLPGCAGIKIFMGSTTGSLLVKNDDLLERVLSNGFRRVAVHCEDEYRLIERKPFIQKANVHTHPLWRDEQTAFLATKRLLSLAQSTKRRVHVLHVSSAQEITWLQSQKDIATVEVTPQHLMLSAPKAYDDVGTLAQMNPPIRDMMHQQALWDAVSQGNVDVLGSDHAPHTLEEKAREYPQSPAGMPGVQTMLPLMLHAVNQKKLSLLRAVELLAHGPQRVYGIVQKGRLASGYDADLTIVDMNLKKEIQRSWIASRCGWTPFEGMMVQGWPVHTLIQGQHVVAEGEIIDKPKANPVRFLETL